MNRHHPLKSLMLILLSALFLHGCQQALSAKVDHKKPLVGGDRDVHGCIGSAGYQWCAKENQCKRPWELAQEKGLESSAGQFAQYCNASM